MATERAYYQNAAPHLYRHVNFLITTYSLFKKGKIYLGCGLALYEFLTRKQNQLIQIPNSECMTLTSAKDTDTSQLASNLHEQFREYLGRDAIMQLIPNYGANPCDVLGLCAENRALALPLSPILGSVTAQVHYAVMHEMVVCLKDVMFRRTHVGIFDPSPETAKRCADILAPLLIWNDARIDEEIRNVNAF